MQLLILVDEAKEAKVDSLRHPFEGLFFWEYEGSAPVRDSQLAAVPKLPQALKARWIREQPAKLCKTDWYLKEQETPPV